MTTRLQLAPPAHHRLLAAHLLLKDDCPSAYIYVSKMEELGRRIHVLETNQQRNEVEERQLQQLLQSRQQASHNLQNASVTESAEAPGSQVSSAATVPSLLDTVVFSVIEATRASVNVVKNVAGLIVESAADTVHLCAPPPPTLEHTLQQLGGCPANLPQCVLDILPHDLKAAQRSQELPLVGDAKLLLTNFCELTLLMDSSVHGRSNKLFHDLCDARGPTIALFLAGNNLFGYYVSKSSGMGIQKAPGSFMFSVFRDGSYRPSVYSMRDSSLQLLPSAVAGALPVGWFMGSGGAGAPYYWCESTRHVQAMPPLIDRHQAQLGPRSSSASAVGAALLPSCVLIASAGASI
jgi:hypothetical protein